MTRVLPLLGLLFTASASAADGLEWEWEGANHRYLLGTTVTLGEPMWVRGTVNRDTRLYGFAIDLVTTCVGESPRGGKAYNVVCTLDDLSVRLESAPTDPGILQSLAEEYEATYEGKPVQFVMRDDGRIRDLDIAGVDTSNRRIDQIHQPFREMIKRTFALLEVRLPRKGTDRGAGSWSEVGTTAMGVPSTMGTMGRAEVTITLGDANGGQQVMDIAAKGIIGPAEMIMVNGTERPRTLYDTEMAGTAVFDTNDHFLVSQSYSLAGVTTSSSMQGQGAGLAYTQRSEGRVIPADAVVNLPDSGELPHEEPAEAAQ